MQVALSFALPLEAESSANHGWSVLGMAIRVFSASGGIMISEDIALYRVFLRVYDVGRFPRITP